LINKIDFKINSFKTNLFRNKKKNSILLLIIKIAKRVDKRRARLKTYNTLKKTLISNLEQKSGQMISRSDSIGG
jgi:hypothetical protein